MAATPKRKIAFAKALERFTRASIQVSEVRCGGIETGASRGAGAGYFWCKNVLTGTPNPVGLSYGISSWDTWSRYLANEWKVKTQLYDCVLDGSGHSKFAQYDVPYTRSPVCLGVKEATVDGRQFETLGSHLKGVPALGAFVKIDIEGDEWKALAATSDSDLAKIALLDLELHWCLLHQKDSLDTIILTLKRLLKQFEVVGRLVEGDWLHGVGCGRFPLQTSMMSVSYVNKAALLGRIVIENTEPHPRRSTEEWCRGLTVATSRNGAFKWCNRLLDQVVDGNPVAISAGGAQDSGNWSSILSGVHDTPTRSIRSLPSDDVGATVLGQLQHELQGSKPSSAIVKLDLDGHEWHVLSGLLDEDGNGSTSALDKIAMLDVGMSFCHESTPHRQMVAHVLTEIAERFLVTGRSVGVTNRGLNHIGCLEGQPHSTTVSYVSKRLSFGLDPSGRVLSEYFADKAPIPKVRIDS